MSASALKRMWPILIVPEVREWVIERIERGSLQRIEVGVNSPVRNLSRKGPPIPDDGLAVNIVASGVTVRPVDELPSVRDADLKARVTGRTATVTIGQGGRRHAGRTQAQHLDFVFEVPDMAPKPSPAKVKFRIDGPVPAAAEILASDRLSEFSGTLIDPNASKGTVSADDHARPADQARADQGRHHLCHYRRPRRICRRQAGDEPEARSQHAEGRRQQSAAIRSRATSRSTASRPRWITASRTRAMPTSNCRRRWMMRAARGSGSISGPAISGAIPVKLIGKIGGRRSRQPRRHRGRSHLAEARQYPAGLGQGAGQVRQGRRSTWCRSSNRRGSRTSSSMAAASRSRDRWRSTRTAI